MSRFPPPLPGLARGALVLVFAAVGACDEATAQPTQEQALLDQLERIEARLESLEQKIAEGAPQSQTGTEPATTPPPRVRNLDVFSPAREGDLARDSLRVTMEPGRILLDGEPVTMEELQQRLREAASTQPTLVIQAGQRVPYGQVTKVSDLARELGYRHIAMATEIAEPVE